MFSLFSAGRTSHEVRGLKYIELVAEWLAAQSHLTRGAWIEMSCPGLLGFSSPGRTSHEVRGLK